MEEGLAFPISHSVGTFPREDCLGLSGLWVHLELNQLCQERKSLARDWRLGEEA